jgi:hopanoid biosynthesis associated RND transporter like protein HpnN
MSATSGAVGGIIGAGISLVTRRPAVTACVVLALTVVSLFYASGHLGINTDTADMISPKLPWRQDFIAYRDSFPARDHNIVAVVDAPDGEAGASYARDLAAALERESELFPSVFLAGFGEFFERNGLLYLSVDELEQLADGLIEAQPLLGRLSKDVSGAGILAALGEAIDRPDELPAGRVEELDRIFAELASTLGAEAQATRRPISWGRLIGVDTDPATRQLLLIQPKLDFSRMRPARPAIERIREIGAALRASHGDGISLRLTGTLAMEHEELTSITRSASAAGSAALAMVIVVLVWALRSLRLLVIAVVTLLAGLGLTAGFAAVTVGHLNLLSVAFAVLYVGLGVDFILHLCLRLEELLGDGLDLDSAFVETGRGVGSSLLICAITTAVGFFAFIPTDFDGISELGLISGGGMIISLIVSLSLLPALIKLFWSKGAVPHALARRGRRRFRPRPLPPRVTLGVAATIALIALWLLPGLRFDGNPIHLRDPDAESIRAIEELADDSEAPLFNLAVLAPDAASAKATAQAVSSLETVERAQTVASLVPADQSEKLSIIQDLELLLGSTLADFRPAPADATHLVAELERIVDALARLRSPTPAEESLEIEARAWLSGVPSLPPAEAREAALRLDADVLGNLVDQVRRLEAGLKARAFDRDDLPPELRERWVNAAGQELVEIVPAEDLNDNAASERFVAEVRSVAPHATGLPVVYEEAAATVTRAFSYALTYALLIVSALLVVFLRSVRDALMVLVPIVFAALVTAGVSALLDFPLNFANIIALPLLIGVGVDSGIHMVHRMRTEPPTDGEPLNTSTSRAVFASALTTVASFGNLAFSSHRGMASMGQLLTLGMGMSLIAVLVLLPALMRIRRRA